MIHKDPIKELFLDLAYTLRPQKSIHTWLNFVKTFTNKLRTQIKDPDEFCEICDKYLVNFSEGIQKKENNGYKAISDKKTFLKLHFNTRTRNNGSYK